MLFFLGGSKQLHSNILLPSSQFKKEHSSIMSSCDPFSEDSMLDPDDQFKFDVADAAAVLEEDYEQVQRMTDDIDEEMRDMLSDQCAAALKGCPKTLAEEWGLEAPRKLLFEECARSRNTTLTLQPEIIFLSTLHTKTELGPGG